MTFAKAITCCAAMLLVTPAYAQTTPRNCAPHAVVAETLAGQYGESRHAAGLVANGQLMELYASTDSGSWTITLTAPSGMTCLLASGQNFEALDDPLPAAGVDG